jgi:hypothetical protein
MLLAGKLIQAARPHPGCQRLGLAQIGFADVVEQVDGWVSSDASEKRR